MIKKLIVVAVVGFVAVSAVKGTKWYSYVRSEVAGWEKKLDDKITPEKEVARLRNELRLMDGDISKVVDQLARTEAEVARLEKDVKHLTTLKADQLKQFNARADAYDKAKAKPATEPDAGYVVFGDVRLGLSIAHIELQKDATAVEATKRALESSENALATRKRIEVTLRRQFNTLKAQKVELAREVDALEAEVEGLKLAQMESKYQTDTTRLAKFKESARNLRTKLDVEKRKLQLMQEVGDAGAPSATGPSVADLRAKVNDAKPAPRPALIGD